MQTSTQLPVVSHFDIDALVQAYFDQVERLVDRLSTYRLL